MPPKKPEKFDLVIIGSGPAGIQAAVQAAKFGKKAAIVEKEPKKLGGAWIHTGTIPSKTLRETLATIHSIHFHAGENWVDRLVHSLSAEKVFGRAFAVAAQEENVVREFIGRNKVTLISGYGSIESRNAVRVVDANGQSSVYETDYMLVATGSRPRRPAEVPFDGWRIVDSDELLNIKSVPKKMVIYGAGVIGCEYACIFRGLGTDVTILDGRDSIMRGIDRECAEELKTILENEGIKFEMLQNYKGVSVDGPNVMVQTTSQQHSCDLFFFAAGRESITKNIGLERLNIATNDRGAIDVNKHFQTCIPNIYAAGDVIGSPALAATSAEQGRYACAHAFGKCKREFPAFFPVGIYTIPEMSSVGKSEEELIAEKIPYEVGRASFKEVARGYIRGDNQGLLKILVCKKTQRLLGIHIVGPDAANLIHTGLATMLYDGSVQDLVDRIIFNYPTLAETYRIAAFNALNKIFPDGIFAEPPAKLDHNKKGAA